MLHGFTFANLRNARRPRLEQNAFRQVSPRRKKSASGEVFLWGHRADRKPAIQLSPMKPQLRGAFALQAKNLTYGRRRFDRTTAWPFNKKCNGRATRSKPCNSRDGKAAGDARRIATLPGAAARAPNKQDSDVRPRGAATKVRTPLRQTSNATLEAAFAFGGQPVTVARGNEPTNHRHTIGAISFPVRLVTTSGTTFGADTQ